MKLQSVKFRSPVRDSKEFLSTKDSQSLTADLEKQLVEVVTSRGTTFQVPFANVSYWLVLSEPETAKKK